MKSVTLLSIGLLVVSVVCFPKFDDGSSIDYTGKSSKSQDQLATPTNLKSRTDLDLFKSDNDIINRTQEPRFGFTNVADNTGYGISSYAPARIDLGGLLLGAVIGIGTILIIPKLLYVLSGTYGAYARSEDGGIAQVMTKLDDALARHGVDTTSCMQRIACSYSKQAAEAMHNLNLDESSNETVSGIDKFVDILSSNQMMRAALQGTAIQEAMETGRNGQSCARTYQHCGFSTDTILTILAKLAANNVITSAKAATIA
ncbi:PREDICTED: uncharacterized protein LOC105367215 isoform X2 [Ceratosolen solmsi marchali]|uniref:Uncharacterized protein LOC105367215 isoform X2 n=1 Tax=Ceratosolen solmsi marchali TaxID=326594 RepID=A0AAJ7E188_9HYME|nr:PREDICTED: uncharacterized protein LOC105367215 isoform X2 [Ceratosolen solmsi marchali]